MRTVPTLHTLRSLRLTAPLLLLALLLAACNVSQTGGTAPTPKVSGTGPASQPFCTAPSAVNGIQAQRSAQSNRDLSSYTPQQFRDVYGVTSLINQGYTGKGQTVVVIDSFGNPSLQDDINAFDQQYNLPPITLQILAPLGSKPFDPNNQDMAGWAGETSLDVQVIHSIAPDAGIVVLTSPVDETEGTVGLPQFRQIEEYAVNHHLGNIISQSWGASEVTLADQAGQQEIQQWTNFYQQATQSGTTFFVGSGDNGATDLANCDVNNRILSTTPTTSFPSDEPWVTSVGGTTVSGQGSLYSESAWNGSGGGFSKFFKEPSFQQGLPASNQSQLNNRRGVPDVAANGDPASGWPVYVLGQQQVIGGTSAACPLWAALMAIADQMAGHSLGFINPALYKLGLGSTYTQDFNDVTTGNNSAQAQGTPVQGYNATTGWDPITGWGTPNAANLLPALIAAAK